MIIQEIQNLFLGIVNTVSGGDVAIKGFVMLWLLAVSSWFARNIPSKIWNFIKLHSLVSITLNKDDDIKNIEFFNNIENWLLTNNKFSVRSTNISTSDFDSVTGFGYGSHIAFCKGRVYRIYKQKLERNGSNKILESLTVTTIGRNITIFDNVIKQSEVRSDINYIYTNTETWGSNSPWVRVGTISPLTNLIIDPEVKKTIDEAIIFFRDNKEWYIKNGFPYKLTLLLHGNPGTGKTSLIKYIVDLLKADLYDTNLMMFNSNNIRKVKSLSRKNIPSVLSLEDFECTALSRKTKVMRSKVMNRENNENLTEHEENLVAIDPSHIGLSEFLNTLQGVNPLNNVVVIMTTNHLEMVDEAAYRNGRVDLLIEVGKLQFKQIKEYFQYCYDKPFPYYIKNISPMKACDMEALFMKNKFSSSGFIDDLMKINPEAILESKDKDSQFSTWGVDQLYPSAPPVFFHKGISE